MTRQTKLKLRKGFENAPLVYKVLAVNMLKGEDEKLVTKTLVKVNTDKQAQALVVKGNKWGYTKVFGTDRVGIITYKGVEVALMFKRVTVMVEPLPNDPAPEGALENPEDVWIRYNLSGVSPRQATKHIRSEIESQEREGNLLNIELGAKNKLITDLQTQVKTLTTQLTPKRKAKK